MTTRQLVLLAAPVGVLVTTTLAFQFLATRLAPKTAYLGGFLFYWLVWCLAVPWWALGTKGVAGLFAVSGAPLGKPAPLGLALLALPPLLGFGYAFPRAIRASDAGIVALSAVLALVNAPLEEILWRGAYQRLFPGSLWLGYLYPTVGFAVWHLAPQTLFPNRAPGGRWSFVAVSAGVGLVWGWVARSSGSLLAPTASHVLLDFSGLGGRLYLR